MFTGLIEEIGTIITIEKKPDSFDLTIAAEQVLDGVQLGDSICVNGVCLTVTHFTNKQFTVGLAPETLQRTSLSKVIEGARVNLERAMTPTTRMGGHYVQGHVDGTGEIIGFEKDHDALWVKIETPDSLLRYIVEKGYIAIDGTSLTVVEVTKNWFSVTLITHTQNHITLPHKSIGDRVNLEVDIMAKYVEKFVTAGAPTVLPSVSHKGDAA